MESRYSSLLQTINQHTMFESTTIGETYESVKVIDAKCQLRGYKQQLKKTLESGMESRYCEEKGKEIHKKMTLDQLVNIQSELRQISSTIRLLQTHRNTKA